MKKLAILFIAATMALAAADAQAIDFKAKGIWQVGMGLSQRNFVKSVGGNKTDSNDIMNSRSRIRFQMDAVASESLSGSVHFEIGHIQWGQQAGGGALGADSTSAIKVRMAFMDWQVPDTSLKVRMGLQNLTLPTKAGNSSVAGNLDVAGIVASWQFSETVGLSALWLRPFNDNYSAEGNTNYLDNMDIWGLTLPVRLEGFEMTPWVLYGIRGKNTFNGTQIWNDGNPMTSMGAYPFGMTAAGARGFTDLDTDKTYGSLFWAGLTVAITAFDPWNIEFELNYGYVEGMGRYDALERGVDPVRGSTQRQGWLAKALVEYKTDWGRPGIFGWYGSGDDGDIKNGSERLPSLRANGMFSSVMGDDVHYGGSLQDQKMTYAGTWGLGLQVADVSSMEDLKHTFRVLYWGGTNSPSMVKYATTRTDWNYTNDYEGIYLTTNDGLLEFNINSVYQVYDNFSIGLWLGYIANLMDSGTWQDGHAYLGDSYSKQDIWNVDLTFAYTF